jgi:FkbM family methyltransferase
MFYSQQKEDIILYEKYLNYRDGFFIELGAMDGIRYSNTLFFEQQLGWKGVLIEANNEQYLNLIKNRPNCYNFNYAISENDGEVEFIGYGAVGGMVHTMTDEHKYGWNLDKTKSYKVKSSPIRKVIENLNIDKVDLFSIDVEGGELEVLKTFDWNIPVYIICIEMAHHYTESGQIKVQEYRNFMKTKGFEFDFEIGVNEIWINKNYTFCANAGKK